MDLKELVFLRSTWVLTFLLCVSQPLIVETQILGCSIQEIDLQPCLNQGNNSMDSCCKILNQVIKTGYNCLCSMLASPNPLLSTPLALPFSNCYISAPPLTQCGVAARAVPPPDISKMPPQIPQPSAPKLVLNPMPPQAVQAPLNLTQGRNFTTDAEQPYSRTKTAPKSSIVKCGNEISCGGDDTHSSSFGRVFLILVLLHSCIL
ncbi:hypothetical protein HHK36_022721 [Tetracentron sinense]|uniref:Bifunctional inhibitor/plant lipid transfer protein/seed storage helical domain-containing protein n=1 Tax=Tetracentron sinense TaxID=13715 RepID=A0A834YND3_TETSI|nr:hypothetical protein HHK36_022721 [Tetracentron sinense]